MGSFKKISELKYRFQWVEKWLKNWQLKHLPQNLKDLMPQNEGVVIKDGVIKLIANDRRREYHQRWVEKIHET